MSPRHAFFQALQLGPLALLIYGADSWHVNDLAQLFLALQGDGFILLVTAAVLRVVTVPGLGHLARIPRRLAVSGLPLPIPVRMALADDREHVSLQWCGFSGVSLVIAGIRTVTRRDAPYSSPPLPPSLPVRLLRSLTEQSFFDCERMCTTDLVESTLAANAPAAAFSSDDPSC